MKKYIIMWDYGYGEEYEEVETESEEEAQEIAYQNWKEGAEGQANYAIIGESTEELRDGYL